MSDPIASVLSNVAPLLLSDVLISRRQQKEAIRQKRVRLAEDVERELLALHLLMRYYEQSPEYSRKVAIHLRSLAELKRTSGHLVPRGWVHTFEGVRASVGEALGIVGAASWSRDLGDYEIEPYSQEWQEKSEVYIAYISRRFATWGLNPTDRAAKKLRPLQFDAWLAEREKSPFTRF